MELKFDLFCRSRDTFNGVLIVPLWNWNDRQQLRLHQNKSFNRTFMELKLGGGEG